MTNTIINANANAYSKAIKAMDKQRTAATNLFLAFTKETMIPIAQSKLGVGEVIESFRLFFSTAFPTGINQAWINDVKSSTRQGLSLLSAISGGSYTFRQGTKDKTSSTYRPFISWIEGSPAAETSPLPVEASSTEPATTEPEKTEPEKTEPATTEPEKTEPATTEPATATPATEAAMLTMDSVTSWILECTDEELTDIRSVVLAELKRRADQSRRRQREIAKAA